MSTKAFPPTKPRTPGIVFPFLLFVELVLMTMFSITYLAHRSDEATLQEFETSRPQVLTTIQGAVDEGDIATLQKIAKRYSGIVKDQEFQRRLTDARARLIAMETRRELAASRILDMARQTEEQRSR